ncbi:NINE protein [Speluncibacter jeojiensis]|uniref:NINE protein n=1 Tax=Speluncibacter jeojiensis TaxID=2710754 RepID=A0A9X4M583_9ACTN|nr:NINE protein [Corynebacteriales bacterium D3-21]
MTTPDPADPGSPNQGDQQPHPGLHDPSGPTPTPPAGEQSTPPLPPVHLPTEYLTAQYPADPYPTEQYPADPYAIPQYPASPQYTSGYPQQGYAQHGYGQTQYGGPQYGAPGYGQPSPAPFGFDPITGLPYSDKSKVAAGLLSIFFGFFGIGRFYAGHTGLGIAQLAVNIALTLFTLGLWLFAAWIWPLVDGIVLLAGNPRDQYGRPLR